MASMTWIKIITTIFDDEKIKLIDSLPDRDAILVIWFKILCQAGKSGCGGALVLADRIPLSDEMLSTVFNRPLNTVRLALKTFQEFGMIEITEERIISIPKWEKYQQVDYLEIKREQDRKRQQKRYHKLKMIESVKTSREDHANLTREDSADTHAHLTHSHAPDIDIDLEKEKEKDLNTFARNDFSKSEKYVSEPTSVLSSTETGFEIPECEKPSKAESGLESASDSVSPRSEKKASPPPHQRIRLDPRTFRFQGILPDDIFRWQETFPAVNVEQELRKMELWAVANPAKRKSNWFRFITNWLSREQEREGFSRPRQRTENEMIPKTFEQIKAERTHAAAKQVLDEFYGPKDTEDSSGTISI